MKTLRFLLAMLLWSFAAAGLCAPPRAASAPAPDQ